MPYWRAKILELRENVSLNRRQIRIVLKHTAERATRAQFLNLVYTYSNH